MQGSDLIKYIKEPQLLRETDVLPLKKLTEAFPYFQSAQLLFSISAKMWDTSLFQQSLKRTAILVNNRSHFFDLIQDAEKHLQQPVLSKKEVDEVKTSPKFNEAAVKQEIDILKSAEMAVEQSEENQKAILNKPSQVENPDSSFLEEEIDKQLVNSLVEKEMLQITETAIKEPKQTEAESFTAWLQFLKQSNSAQTKIEIEPPQDKPKVKYQAPVDSSKKREMPEENELLSSKKLKQKALIDKIIESSPGLIRAKEEKFFTPDTKAKESLLENEHLVTETLAKIYALQGNISKAIRSYEILSLKYPQKSTYFAGLIKKLKNNP